MKEDTAFDGGVEEKPVSKDAGGPVHDVIIFREVCEQECSNVNEHNTHMSTHKPKISECVFDTEFELKLQSCARK